MNDLLKCSKTGLPYSINECEEDRYVFRPWITRLKCPICNEWEVEIHGCYSGSWQNMWGDKIEKTS